MDNRKFQAAAIATPPAAEASPSNGYPTDGNPAGGIPATVPGAAWFNQIGEELRAVLTAASITPDHTVLTQLLAAIQYLIGAHGTILISEDATVVAGSANLDTYTDTLASLSFTPGRWIVMWNGGISVLSGGGTGFCLPELTLTDSANTVIKKAKGLHVAAALNGYSSPVGSFVVIDVAATTTFKLRFCAASYSGTPTLTSVSSTGTITKTSLMGIKL